MDKDRLTQQHIHFDICQTIAYCTTSHLAPIALPFHLDQVCVERGEGEKKRRLGMQVF